MAVRRAVRCGHCGSRHHKTAKCQVALVWKRLDERKRELNMAAKTTKEMAAKFLKEDMAVQKRSAREVVAADNKAAKKAKLVDIRKQLEERNEIKVMAVLHQRFNGRCTINGIEMLNGKDRSRVFFIKPNDKTKKVVCAVVRTGKKPSVTFTKHQPGLTEKPEPKPTKKGKQTIEPRRKAKRQAAVKKAKAKKATKKSKATGRGKAVVVYFAVDNLEILKAAKKAAKADSCGLNSIVAQALYTFLK